MSQEKNTQEKKLTWKGWIALLFLIIFFSGIFQNSDTFLRALDINALTGTFGEIYEGLDFTGSGGTGANAGFLFALSLLPITAFSMGVLDVVEALGAMEAARKLFSPILRPIWGIPGTAGIAFIASFTSSDITAVMTKRLYEEGQITDDERTIFAAYQYSSSAVIGNVISTQAPLLPIILWPMGAVIVVLVVFKTVGSTFMRLWISRTNRKEQKKLSGNQIDQEKKEA